MEIELRLPSRLEAVIKNLTRYRPPAMLAGWTVISYHIPIQVQANAETRLSSQVDIRRDDEWAFVVVDLLIGELTKDESSKLHILLEPPDLSTLTPRATPDKVPPCWTRSQWANHVASTPLAPDPSPLTSDHLQQNPQDALAAWLDWFCKMLEQDYQGVAEQLEALALELGVIDATVTTEIEADIPKGGRFGTDRDMSFGEVSRICMRVREWQARGGKIPDWHREYGHTDRYTLGTLYGWLKQDRFRS